MLPTDPSESQFSCLEPILLRPPGFQNIACFTYAPLHSGCLWGSSCCVRAKITRDQLGRALRRQSSELIYEMLRWKDGHFELRKYPTSLLAGTARLGLQAATLVMEGFRRLEDWQHIESTLGAFESPVYPDSALAGSAERLSLSRVEQYVLSLVDGERTIREILASSNLSTFETCRVLAALLGTGFVRRKTA
jgi:hypothetical protein